MVLIMYKYHLEDVEWSEFSIKDIFKTHFGTNGLQTPTGSYIKKELFSESKLPRITVRETNNGIDSFVHSSDKKFRIFENFISVSFLGGVFYHPYKASIDMKVHALIPRNFELNRYNAQFLINAVKNNLMYSSYGNQLSSTDLPRVKVMLPLDEEQNPNWHFMEEYIKERENKQRNDLNEYCKSRLLDLVLCPEVLTDVEWREFFMGGNDGIFDITATKSGIDKNKLNIESGNVPYITRSEIDNGINLFIINKQKEKYKQDEGNAITIGLDTQTVFYQSNSFFTGQNIQVLRNENLNKNNAMFIIPLLKIQMQKFNWGGNGATLGRLNRTKIALPIDLNGEPNWAYMENFIKNIEQKQIKNILKYLDEYI
ncbi:restriction endonuclease subunit S [Campylobacter sp. faydin G-140]|uniref:restriction endonuclease subunit S n=1 Tax=Campylobacter anatolicus TaxID=2829105 RepID=UPI001B98FD9B|nr:restriction endonuclease subunit S [Campylobacter anatolicus]MBR8465580.1 restriction endonuclease subunit S [Campylobacter anatolicus]